MSEEMQEVRDSLARIETKMDQVAEIAKDHETRLRGLEKWRWLVVGGFTALGVGIKTLLGK